MKPHPYLRAYMAGALVPTLFVMVVACVYAFLRFGLAVPFAIERGILFPMAFVPNIWGLWNVLFVRIHEHHNWPLGIHGALLPCILAPLGVVLASVLSMVAVRGQSLVYFEVLAIPYAAIAVAIACAMILYYLLWRYFVGFLNGVVGVA